MYREKKRIPRNVVDSEVTLRNMQSNVHHFLQKKLNFHEILNMFSDVRMVNRRISQASKGHLKRVTDFDNHRMWLVSPYLPK